MNKNIINSRFITLFVLLIICDMTGEYTLYKMGNAKQSINYYRVI